MKTRMMVMMAVISMVVSSGASAASVGDRVPDLSVASTGGDAVNLRTAEGWKIVYFYPKSFTPGCTKQACGLRDSKSEFEDLDVTVFGVSTDDLETQKKFKAEYNLPFELLADDDKKLSRALGALGFAGMAKRMTFIISPEGIITDIMDSVSVGSHDQDIIKILNARRQAE